MKLNLRKLAPVVMAAAIMVSLSSAAFAADRTAKTKSTPVYPDLAKRMNISGTVKVEVTVAPNGHVTNAKALGGHPLLVESAVTAAKQFKYEPSTEETKEVVEFQFHAAN